MAKVKTFGRFYPTYNYIDKDPRLDEFRTAAERAFGRIPIRDDWEKLAEVSGVNIGTFLRWENEGKGFQFRTMEAALRGMGAYTKIVFGKPPEMPRASKRLHKLKGKRRAKK